MTAASADPLGQGHDDPLWSAHVGHAPDELVLSDATDQAVAVRGQSVDGRLEVVDLEGHVAQPQLVGHRSGRSWLVVGPDEARQLQSGTSVGRPQHDDLGAGVGDADDGVQECAFDRHPRALDLEAQRDEERRHRVQVRDRHADVVEASDAWRSEEHTSELQSRQYLVCRLLLEKKKNKYNMSMTPLLL